jgi:hypothetical protein
VPAHMSNSDRIARAAAEASAKAAEKAEKAAKKAATPRTRKPREPKAPPRLKIVWAVGDPGAAPVATFPYADRAAADADCARRGKNCQVRPLKVPMED